MSVTCTIVPLENNLYEVIFHAASHAAVESWLQQIEMINARYTSSDMVRYLVNTPMVGGLPVIYIMRASQEYARQHPERPRTRTAALYADELQSSIIYVHNLLTSWMRDKREVARFFRRSQRDDAIAWLFAEE